MKKNILILALCAIICLNGFVAFAASEVRLIVNGNELNSENLVLKNGLSYLPAIELGNALGLNVRYSGNKVILGEGEYIGKDTEELLLIVGGESISPEDGGALFKEGDTIYVPIRAAAEKFGKKVIWDGDSRSIIIEDVKPLYKLKIQDYTVDGQTDVSHWEVEYPPSNAFDENAKTFYDGHSGGWCGIEVKEPVTIAKFRFMPRENQEWRMPGTEFQISSDGINYTTIYKVTESGKYGEYTTVSRDELSLESAKLLSENKYRYFRFFAGESRYASISEIEVYVEENLSAPSSDYINKICTIENKNSYLAPSSPERGKLLTVVGTAHNWRFKGFMGGSYSFLDENNMSADVSDASKEAGHNIIHWTSSGATNQRWTLEKADDGFYIKSLNSQLYLTETDGLITQELKNENLNQIWKITVVGEFEPIVEQMLASEAAKSLPKYKYDRLYSHIMAGGEFNFLVYNKVETKIIEENYFNLPYEDQVKFVNNCFSIYPVELMSGSMATKIKRDIKVEYVGIEEGAWESWHGIPNEKPRRYNITITDTDTGDFHLLEYICPYDNDEEYAMQIGEAIGYFDMPIIKCLKRFTYTSMNTSSWNGSNGKIWNNTGYRGDVNNMVQYFAHEIGHVMDTEDTSIWQRAIVQDMIPVTGYGNTNRWEDLAEFSRMYLLARGDEARTAPIEMTYPARAKAYKALLYTKDNEFYAEYKDEYEEVINAVDDYSRSGEVRLSHEGRYLTDESGRLVFMDAAASSDLQTWEIYSEKAGSSKLRNKGTGRYITLSGSALALGDEGTAFGLKSTTGGYLLIDTATGFAINRDMSVTTEKGAVWSLEEIGNLPFAGDFTLRLQASGKYLSCSENNLTLSDTPVTWNFNPVDPEYIIIKDKSTGKTIDISGGSESEGAKAIMYSVTGGKNQHFRLVSNGDGTYKLEIRHSGLYLTYIEDGFCQTSGKFGDYEWTVERAN